MGCKAMTDRAWLKLGLSLTVIIILGLSCALAASLQWSLLAILTLVFVLSYPLIWIAWRSYQYWRDALVQLTSFAQLLQEGDANIRFNPSHKQGLLSELQQEIGNLGKSVFAQNQYRLTVDSVIANIMDNWQTPVALFDDKQQLIYRNSAMANHLGQPMLAGVNAQTLGFELKQQEFTHPGFTNDWQNQTMNYIDQGQQRLLFCAVNIRKPLHQQHNHAQNNLVRVLGHEIRNSLTPISSMADTLLSAHTLPEVQTRQALERIGKRADRLLRFIEHYAKLSQIPTPSCQWFDLDSVIAEAQAMVPGLSKVEFIGEQQLYGDPVQLSQVFINLLKNAYEAAPEQAVEITIKHYHNGSQQRLSFTDNGPGFANPDNVTTPFYTTKASGSGIGLALCREILLRHEGSMTIDNTPTGARIELSLPIPTKTRQLPMNYSSHSEKND